MNIYIYTHSNKSSLITNTRRLEKKNSRDRKRSHFADPADNKRAIPRLPGQSRRASNGLQRVKSRSSISTIERRSSTMSGPSFSPGLIDFSHERADPQHQLPFETNNAYEREREREITKRL